MNSNISEVLEGTNVCENTSFEPLSIKIAQKE